VRRTDPICSMAFPAASRKQWGPNECWHIAHAYIVPCNLAGMRRDGVLTDLTIVVEGRNFPVHRVVVAASSPYFRALLTNAMAESFVSSVELKQVSVEAFEEILNFMYTGEATISSLLHAVELLAAAEQFCMRDLSNITFQAVKDQATVSDYPELLAEGRRFGLRDLEGFASARCHETFEQLVLTHSFLRLPPTLMLELLESEFLLTKDEEVVVSSAVAWVEALACEAGNPARVEVWPEVFKRLRFQSMNPSVLPRLWPKLAPHCTDAQTCRELLWGLSGSGKEGVVAQGARWFAREPNVPEDAERMAEELFQYAKCQPERGQLCATLLARKDNNQIRREVIHKTQIFFEKEIAARKMQAAAREWGKEDCARHQELFEQQHQHLTRVADLMSNMVQHNILGCKVIRECVLEPLHDLNSDEARMHICTLRHGLLRRREEVQRTVTMQRLAEVAELELSRTSSPWQKLELRKTIQELRG